MNTEQQRIVSQKIQKDAMFIQAYMSEVTAKRNMRLQSLDFATKHKSVEQKTTDQILKDAEEIYMFLSKDGGLEDLKESKIIS